MMFSKLKAWIRAGEYREVAALVQAIGQGLSAVTLRDIFGWITHAHPQAFLCQML